MKTTIGGNRLGSGNKQEVHLKNYARSTHDLGYLWRSSMAAGTLVPFMSEVGLPGDSFDINLNAEVMTLPTIGPLFGSYKVQLDVFTVPIRLYNGKLHMNKLGIGMDMSKIKLPQIELEADYNYLEAVTDNSQINASSIFSYLNIRGLGIGTEDEQILKRQYNAISFLGYWDIYKNYYANKQEERGFVIHNTMEAGGDYTLIEARIKPNGSYDGIVVTNTYKEITVTDWAQTKLDLRFDDVGGMPDPYGMYMQFQEDDGDPTYLTNAFAEWEWISSSNIMRFTGWQGITHMAISLRVPTQTATNADPKHRPISLKEFPLKNIDDMREDILADVKNPNPFILDKTTYAPYGLPNKKDAEGGYSKQSSQEGLAIKTYQSDLFNNWISTEWIDGDNGINEVTAIATTGDSFTIDALNLASKVYNMLNRIAVSGGSYDDWLDAVYTHERAKSTENPVYHGSLIKELGFEEVISNAETEDNPLGTLAGRGRLTNKNKGGKIKIKIDEPSYIIGIASITPRVDYSQGNKWDTNLKTMNDFHKPALDEIGYQDLITDQMAWFDTEINEEGTILYKKAGKQPAWINYMTNVNQVRGNFAEEDAGMFMTLNRRYEMGRRAEKDVGIGDLTTYVDPTKFNHIFAETALDAQNFWVQISSDITARRKMSAKVIPNL